MARLALVVLLVAGCGSNERAPESATDSAEEDTPSAEEGSPEGLPRPAAAADARDGFFVAEGSPDPLACETERDCVGDTIPDVGQPCCNDPRSLRAHATAYRAWIQSWRGTHCADVTCPPPPPPARPPDCAFSMQCIEGRCADRCE